MGRSASPSWGKNDWFQARKPGRPVHDDRDADGARVARRVLDRHLERVSARPGARRRRPIARSRPRARRSCSSPSRTGRGSRPGTGGRCRSRARCPSRTAWSRRPCRRRWARRSTALARAAIDGARRVDGDPERALGVVARGVPGREGRRVPAVASLAPPSPVPDQAHDTDAPVPDSDRTAVPAALVMTIVQREAPVDESARRTRVAIPVAVGRDQRGRRGGGAHDRRHRVDRHGVGGDLGAGHGPRRRGAVRLGTRGSHELEHVAAVGGRATPPSLPFHSQRAGAGGERGHGDRPEERAGGRARP